MEVYFHLLKLYFKQQFMLFLLAIYPWIVHFGDIWDDFSLHVQ